MPLAVRFQLVTLGLLLGSAGARAQDVPADTPTNGAVPASDSLMEAPVAYPWAVDSTGAADVAGEAEAVPLDSTLYPVAEEAPLTLDSLRMSPWERLWWGRRGAFRLTGLFPTHPDDPTADLRQIASVRRRLLSTHQIAGLVTVGSMAATVVGGQVAFSTGNSDFHKTIVPITIGLYSGTAALALLSPPRLYTGGSRRVDTIQVHKWLAIGHVAGMILTPLLAPTDGEGRRLHQTMGYATFATFSAAMLTVTLFR